MKKGFKFLALVLVIFIIVVLVFFKNTEAPIIQGGVNLNVQYKDGLSLDIYQPTKELYPKSPVVVYYHGGAWVSGSKITVNNDRFHGAFNTLREKGYTIISPDYTLAEYKKSPFPYCIEDAFDVIRWIETNASQHNFDIDNVGVLGESAGGHLALMVAYAEAGEFTEPHKISLSYVVGVYPPTDLRKLYGDLEEVRQQVIESTDNLPDQMQNYFDINQYLFGFDSDQDTIRANKLFKLYSPISYVDDNIPNTLLIHGNQDRVVPVSQSITIRKKIESTNHSLNINVLDGVDHAFMNATPEQKQQTQKWIIDFILEQNSHSKLEN